MPAADLVDGFDRIERNSTRCRRFTGSSSSTHPR